MVRFLRLGADGELKSNWGGYQSSSTIFDGCDDEGEHERLSGCRQLHAIASLAMERLGEAEEGSFSFVGAFRELFIRVTYGQLVIFTDALRVGIGEIQLTGGIDFNQRCRVVHNAFTTIRAGQIVMWEA